MAGGAGSNTGTPAASNPLGPQQSQSIPGVYNGPRTPPMTREDVQRYNVKMHDRGTEGRLPQPPQPFGNQFGGGFGGGQQQPEMMMSDMQYRPERQQPFGGQFGQPMQNPFQPQQPSFMQDPEFQGYQTQMQDLNRQMNEYMQKAPMYQQMQDLQGKMAPFQQRYQQQQMQQMQQPSPFRRGQFQQPAGLQGLMGMLGGRGGMQQPQKDEYEQYVDSNSGANSPLAHVRRGPTMSRADFEAREQQLMSRLQPRMSMDMPYAQPAVQRQYNEFARDQESALALRDATAQRYSQMYRMG